MKNLQFVTRKKKKKKTLKTCYMMMWHVNPCHITLGPHHIHVNFLKLQITLGNVATIEVV